MRRAHLLALILLPAAAIALAAASPSRPQTSPVAPVSGFTFLSPESQALQNDDFANPGMLWVEQGERIWNDASAGPSCASCHADASIAMRGVATRYPAFYPSEARVVSLEQAINISRTKYQNHPAFPYESQDLLAITAFIARQSRGLPQAASIDGPAAASFERGRAFFYQRRGQLNLACANCHEQHVGDHLRGEPISQGQINGFPIYRELWQTLGSTHRMFAWCNDAVRAQPYPAGSQEYVDLELFEKWRGAGLPIETPAIRR